MQDKDAYIRRYEKANKPLSAFQTDIKKYQDLADDILAEDSSTNITFLVLDTGPLKSALLAHCEAWVTKFTRLLLTLATSELARLHNYFDKNTTELTKVPNTLE